MCYCLFFVVVVAFAVVVVAAVVVAFAVGCIVHCVNVFTMKSSFRRILAKRRCWPNSLHHCQRTYDREARGAERELMG